MKKKSSAVFGVMFLAMLVGNYFQYQLSPVAGRVMADFNLTQTQFSSVFSAPMIPAIVLSIAAGVLSDRFGIKKTCGIAVLIAAIGLCYRPFAHDYKTILLAMILGGVGTTFLNVNVAKILGEYYAIEKIGTMVGMAMMGSTIGMTLATSTTAVFSSVKTAMIVAAVGEVIVLFLWFLIMDEGKKIGKSETKSQDKSLQKSIGTVVKCRYIWILGICMMCILGCNTAMGSFVPIALQSRGVSETVAGFVLTGMMIGNFIGTFVGPRLVAACSKQKVIISVLGILSAVTAAISWTLPTGLAFVGLMICGFGMGTLLPIFMSMPIQLREIGPELAGTAGGITSTLELLGAVIIPTYIITPISGTNYRMFFILTGLCMIVMTAASFFLPKSSENK